MSLPATTPRPLEISRLDLLAAAAAEVAAQITRSVVSIEGRRGGHGAGTIWSADGLIVTNNHVAPGDSANVVTWDDRRFPARALGHSPADDLAILQVDAHDLEPLTAADSDLVRVGQIAIAVGHPWGQRGAVSSGIVFSANGGAVENGIPLEHAIRADVSLAPGNSGGPLVDADGRVIGINAMIAGGMAVAVPSNVVQRFLDEGMGQAGMLGLVGVPVEIPANLSAEGIPEQGLIVTAVNDGGPADAAGMIPGDVLLAVDDAEAGLAGVARDLQRLRAGRLVRLTVLRGGNLRVVEATPGPRA